MIKLFALGPFAPHLCVFFSQVLNICFLARLTPAARQEAKSCSSKNETKPNKKEINRVLKLLKAVDSTLNEFVIKYFPLCSRGLSTHSIFSIQYFPNICVTVEDPPAKNCRKNVKLCQKIVKKFNECEK